MNMTMQTKEIIEFKLQPALAECALHRQRLHQAWLEACEFGAFNQTPAPPLSDEEVRTLDQMVFRFGRLQDAIGMRLLPALLQLTQEWRDNEPFLDKLNRAEKLAMLPSVEQWQLLRELRNQTAHEYPAQPECCVPCDHIPLRRWPLFKARDVMRGVIESFRAESTQ